MRNRFAKIINAFLMLVILQSATAETHPTQQDFAFFATLSEGQQSLRQFELPYQTLAELKRQDYGDIRIFNSQNQLLPFNISQTEPQTYHNHDVYGLRFFRLADNSNQHSGLQIKFSENSTRFSFDTNLTAGKDRLSFLLIENQHQSDDLQAIKLDWQQPDAAFSIKVKLESSDDLQNWQTVNDSTTLYDLKYAETSLLQNTIHLPDANHAKYLRLSFQPSHDFSLQIEKISGTYQHTTSVEQENWQSIRLEAGEQPNEWFFNTGGLIPVTKIAFKIPAVGLFYQGSLYSKPDDANPNLPQVNRHHPDFKHEIKRALHHYPDYHNNARQENWHYQGTVTQYRLLMAAGEIEGEPISVSAIKERQWKLVLDQPASLLPEQIPSVKVAWQPVRVTFLAQGKPPYRVFWGNSNIAPFHTVLPPMLNNSIETVDVQTIQAVAKVSTAESKSLATLMKSLHWQKVLLWLLLCAGVLVMAGMAYQLYKRMNSKPE